MEAAVAAQERGKDVDVDHLMAEFQQWQEQQLAAARNPANYSAEMRPVMEALQQAEAHEASLARPADPTDTALAMFNDAVRKVRPPTLAEQLAALGIQAEPEPETVSSTSQEA